MLPLPIEVLQRPSASRRCSREIRDGRGLAAAVVVGRSGGVDAGIGKRAHDNHSVAAIMIDSSLCAVRQRRHQSRPLFFFCLVFCLVFFFLSFFAPRLVSDAEDGASNGRRPLLLLLFVGVDRAPVSGERGVRQHHGAVRMIVR